MTGLSFLQSAIDDINRRIIAEIIAVDEKSDMVSEKLNKAESHRSKTVVSQCNNFIIHKIQNPDDIQYISRMVPYMNQGMVDRITYLRRGYALVFGTAINLPTLTAFEKASPSPNSGNSNIVEKWYVD